MVVEAPRTTGKPRWLKVRAPGGERYAQIKQKMRSLRLHTVCEEANCPNIGECWNGGTATMMLMGDVCTRGCRFCDVTTGHPGPLDPKEPTHVAQAVDEMGLDYVVLTSVNRDELADGGAGHFARTVEEIRLRCPETLVETLVPDFMGDESAIHRLVDSGPHVFAHNVETVRSLQRHVRDVRAGYEQSLGVLRAAKLRARELDKRMLTKTSIMVGCGEVLEELVETLRELRETEVDVVTFGQYLRPSRKHMAVERFYRPEEFDELREIALELGFVYCASGPLVRSSYRAGEYYIRDYLESQPSQKRDLGGEQAPAARVEER